MIHSRTKCKPSHLSRFVPNAAARAAVKPAAAIRFVPTVTEILSVKHASSLANALPAMVTDSGSVPIVMVSRSVIHAIRQVNAPVVAEMDYVSGAPERCYRSVHLVMAAAIVTIVTEMENESTSQEHVVYVTATVIVGTVPAQERKNVAVAKAPRKESAMPVMVMENVIYAAVTVPLVVCVMDTAI